MSLSSDGPIARDNEMTPAIIFFGYKDDDSDYHDSVEHDDGIQFD
jgi:hypothetical protein